MFNIMKSVQVCIKTTFVLVWCVTVTIAGINCSNQITKQTNASLPPTDVGPNNNVGHQVGSTSPDFTIRLIHGDTISSTDLLKDGMPIFLFFFSPH